MAEAWDRLVAQHETLLDLFAEILAESDRDELGSLLDRLCDDIEAHMEMEEEYLYVPLEGVEGAAPLLGEGYDEHERIRHELEELYEGSTGGASWHARVRSLQETVSSHFRMEEGELIPLACRTLPPEKPNGLRPGDGKKSCDRY